MNIDRPLLLFLVLSVIFIGLLSLAYWGLINKEEKQFSAVDPLLVMAENKARRTMGEFYELYSQRPTHSFVRHIEDSMMVWSQVTSIEDTVLWVSVLDDWRKEENRSYDHIEVSQSYVKDWLVELSEGKVKGGFSTQASLIRQRQTEKSNRGRQDSLLELFIDPLD